MKYLKKFNQSDTRRHIDYICDKYSISDYSVNDDGSIDVNGNVRLECYHENTEDGKQIDELPLVFRNVYGCFTCYGIGLETLKGSPRFVDSYFFCGHNDLTTLEGGPDIVNGSFNCRSNKIKTLVGGPKIVGASFNCSENLLYNLEGLPETSHDFRCENNKINTLKWCPKDFIQFECDGNNLPDQIVRCRELYGVGLYPILKYMGDYDIWAPDGSLIPFRLGELILDIKENNLSFIE